MEASPKFITLDDVRVDEQTREARRGPDKAWTCRRHSARQAGRGRASCGSVALDIGEAPTGIKDHATSRHPVPRKDLLFGFRRSAILSVNPPSQAASSSSLSSTMSSVPASRDPAVIEGSGLLDRAPDPEPMSNFPGSRPVVRIGLAADKCQDVVGKFSIKEATFHLNIKVWHLYGRSISRGQAVMPLVDVHLPYD